MNSTLGKRAVQLARKGFAVFPLRPGDKRPLRKGWLEDATTDEFQVREWWRETPDANIGIYPGGSTPSYLVVDLDVKDGKDGLATWTRLIRAALEVTPATLEVHTPSGGLHIYFILPEGVKVPPSVEKLGQGVDIRSTGSYVVAPPSVIDEKTYRWGQEGPAPAPDWLIKKAGEAPEKDPLSAKLHPDIEGWDPEDGVQRATAIAEGWPGAVEGTRNHQTFKLAAMLREWAVSYDCALRLVFQWNLDRNHPELLLDEVECTVRSAYEGHMDEQAGAKLAARRATLRNVKEVSLDTTPVDDHVRDTTDWFLRRDEMDQIETPSWLVENTIPERGIVLLYGRWGQYKTFMALDLLLHMNTGNAWAGLKVRDGIRTAYITGEGRYGILRRVEAWEAKYNSKQGVDHFRFGHKMPAFRDEAALRSWAAALAAEEIDVVVIDTVTLAMRGWDENSTQDASEFMAKIMELRDAMKCAVVLVHHSGKDETRGSRGSEELPAKADTVLHVQSPAQGVVTVRMVKQKDAEAWLGPANFRVEKSAESAVLVHDPEGIRTEAAIQNLTWATTLTDVLLNTPKGFLPLANLKLSRQMNAALWEDPETEPSTDGADRILGWIKNTALNQHPELRRYVRQWTDGGAPSTWYIPRKPKKDTET